MQKQNSSSVSGRAVDLAHTLIKAKSPFANILYSELGKASQQAKFHLPGEIQTCNFLVCRRQPDLKRIFLSSAASSKEAYLQSFGSRSYSLRDYSEELDAKFDFASGAICPFAHTSHQQRAAGGAGRDEVRHQLDQGMGRAPGRQVWSYHDGPRWF